MASKKETATIRHFVISQLRHEKNLSDLTFGILKKRYLAHVGCDSLSPEVKQVMKQAVAEELTKMEDKESGSEVETKTPQKKRKREEEEVLKERDDGSKAKKTRTNHSSSSSESKDGKAESEASDDEESNKSGSDKKRDEKGSQSKKKGRLSSVESSEEEMNEPEERGGESLKEPEEESKPGGNGELKLKSGTESKKDTDSDAESDNDSTRRSDDKSEKSEKNSDCESSDDGDGEEKEKVEKKNEDSDSESSLSSQEDKEQQKKRNGKKNASGERESKGEKALNRLKRYISLCGVKKNYQKLLSNCRSFKSKVEVLKKELQDLGVDGTPTIKKCKRVKKKREEAQELAGLDVNNIITTQGRPKRRAAWQEETKSMASSYQHALNSDSDGDRENKSPKGRRRVTDWANLQGIISDDGESD